MKIKINKLTQKGRNRMKRNWEKRKKEGRREGESGRWRMKNW